mmetsp:Transcript_35183/g.73146  ORF Transcript_35183/g.73146 Transcript_35183/m.73146 type:complete len:138 (+) Transcript_35183:399-812(+)
MIFPCSCSMNSSSLIPGWVARHRSTLTLKRCHHLDHSALGRFLNRWHPQMLRIERSRKGQNALRFHQIGLACGVLRPGVPSFKMLPFSIGSGLRHWLPLHGQGLTHSRAVLAKEIKQYDLVHTDHEGEAANSSKFDE